MLDMRFKNFKSSEFTLVVNANALSLASVSISEMFRCKKKLKLIGLSNLLLLFMKRESQEIG